MLRWVVLAGAVVIIAFVVGLRWGIIGVAAAYAITSLVLFYPNFAVPFRLINLPVRDLFGVLWRPFASGLLMLAVILGLRFVLPPDTASAGVLALAALTGIASYLAASWLFNREQLRETASLVR
jgi:hypothetical protein